MSTEQETLVDKDPLKATVPVATLQLIGETLAPVTGMARINVDRSTIYAAERNPSNTLAVATGRHEIESNRIETLALKPSELLETLEWLRPETDDVTLRRRPEESTLVISDDYFQEELDLYDPDSLRSSPDLGNARESIAFEVRGEAAAWEFVGAIETVAKPSKNALRVFPSATEFELEGSDAEWNGDEQRIEITWPYHDGVSADLERTTDAVCVVSDDLVLDMTAALPLEGTLTVQFGDEQALCLSSSEGPTTILAPRIVESRGTDDE